MAAENHKKIVTKIKKKNRGSSGIGKTNTPLSKNIKIQQPDDTYKDQILKFYSSEGVSPEMKRLAASINIGEFWKPHATGLKGKLLRMLSLLLKPFHLLYRFIVAPWVGAQERFNASAVSEMQRIINLNKNVADLLSDKITRLEHKHDLLIDEVVNDHLVKHTRDMVSRMDILYRRLDESFISHDVDIERAKDTLASVKRDVAKIRDELNNIETALSSHKKATKENK